MVIIISIVATTAAFLAVYSLARSLPGDWVGKTRWKRPSTDTDKKIPARTQQFTERIRLSSDSGYIWKNLLLSIDELGTAVTASKEFETQVVAPSARRRWRRSRPKPSVFDRTYLDARIAELEQLTELET